MFKLVLLVVTVALAQGEKYEIGLGSFAKHHPKNLPSTKVVNGRNADLGEFPYQVSLHLAGPLANTHVCGGSLITASTVLTAGQCVTEVHIGNLQHVEVWAGVVSQKDKENAQISKIRKTIVHPDFPGGAAANDLAIHILMRQFILNKFVNVIALPAAGAVPEGTATLSGWGSTSHTQVPSMPDRLQAVDLPIIPYEDCLVAVEGDDSPLDETMVCTGPFTGGYGACSGDSGGPLAQNINGTNTIVGIVSWGFVPCAASGKPSVSTRVSYFIDFIEANTE